MTKGEKEMEEKYVQESYYVSWKGKSIDSFTLIFWKEN